MNTTSTPTDKAFEDLLWVAQSPSLLNQKGIDRFGTGIEVVIPEPSSMLPALFFEPGVKQALQTHLAECKSHFLGPYFESLWEFYLKRHPRYELKQQGLQINQKGKTIGEFDFLVYDNERKVVLHQELAIKFYLGCHIDRNTYWVGPQSIDRLDLKLSKMLNVQCVLSEHPAAKAKLRALGIEKIVSQIVMPGILFQPFGQAEIPVPDYVNPNHLAGSWHYYSAFTSRLDEAMSQAKRWMPLNKHLWLSPNRVDSTDSERLTMSTATLRQQLPKLSEHGARPLMLATLAETHGSLTETDRLMIVPDVWPGLSEASPAL